MLQIVVFVLALVALFAINALVAWRTRDSIVANSTAFSWMRVTEQDVEVAARAAEEQEHVPARSASAHSVRRMARASF